MEVIHLNRTAVAGALSASVAHELNQPLGAIQSHAEAALVYLQADPPNVARAQNILSNILRDDQRAAKIIAHLRGLLKKRNQNELQEFDFTGVVDDTLQIVRPRPRNKESKWGREYGFSASRPGRSYSGAAGADEFRHQRDRRHA